MSSATRSRFLPETAHDTGCPTDTATQDGAVRIVFLKEPIELKKFSTLLARARILEFAGIAC